MSNSKTGKRQAREYTPEFRIQTVRLVVEQGVGLSKASRDLGVPLATLHTWLKKYKDGEWTMSQDNVQSIKIDNRE